MRSTSERGRSRRRPYPPRATTAIPRPRPSARARTASSTRSARRRADHRPWWPGEDARSSGRRAIPTPSTGPACRSDRVGAHLPRADPPNLVGGGDEDLAVADLAGPRCLQDRVDHELDLILVGQDLHLHLRHEVHLVLGPSVNLGVPALPSEPLHLGDRETVDPDAPEGLLHLVELERLDDRRDQLHRTASFSRAGASGTTTVCDADPPRSPNVYPTSACCERSRPVTSSSSSTRTPTIASITLRIPSVTMNENVRVAATATTCFPRSARPPSIPLTAALARSPVRAPVAAPTVVGRRCRSPSGISQPTMAAAAATCVFASAVAASPPAVRADPALKPNHPNHRIAAPMMTIGTLWGTKASFPYPLRRPSTMMAASAATPAFTWTTVPPAKSTAPIRPSQPPPHTQWARGAYTRTDHRPRNRTVAENRIRSATAPVMSAGVMIANIIWY